MDDALVCSKVWCPQCLFDLLQNLWPRDIGLTLEGCTPDIHFLHIDIPILDSFDAVTIIISPHVLTKKDFYPDFVIWSVSKFNFP